MSLFICKNSHKMYKTKRETFKISVNFVSYCLLHLWHKNVSNQFTYLITFIWFLYVWNLFKCTLPKWIRKRTGLRQLPCRWPHPPYIVIWALPGVTPEHKIRNSHWIVGVAQLLQNKAKMNSLSIIE